MTKGALHKGRILVFCAVRRAWIISWFIVLSMLALFALGLVLIIKLADCIVAHPMVRAPHRFDKFVDSDS
jgi:hypothetical protein